MLNKATLLVKLTVDKDLRTVEKQTLKGGRIAHFFDVFKNQLSELLKVQLFFILFLIPAIAILAVLMPYMIDSALSNYNFTTNMGIGYSLLSDSPSIGVIETYSVYKLVILMLIPAIIFAGVGAAGLFYCCRGYMWGEPVVVYKAFFRGIKKLWKYFLPVFTVIALLVAGIGNGIIFNFERIELGNANALSYIIMIFSIVIGFAAIMMLIFLLPMFACYKFKFIDYIKNSALLNMLVLPVSFIIAILTIAPFILIIMAKTPMLYPVIIIVGFIYVALMWTAFSQNIFETMIEGMYNARVESEKKKQEKAIKKLNKPEEFVNPKKKYKTKNKQNNQ